MRRRWCADGTWERREDVGSTCGRIWRGWKTTRREHNEGHLYWKKRVGDTTHAGQFCKFRETLQSDEQYSNSVASLVMRVVREKTEKICFFFLHNSSHVDDDIFRWKILRYGWTKDSYNQRSVGWVSRRWCQKFLRRWIEWVSWLRTWQFTIGNVENWE